MENNKQKVALDIIQYLTGDINELDRLENHFLLSDAEKLNNDNIIGQIAKFLVAKKELKPLAQETLDMMIDYIGGFDKETSELEQDDLEDLAAIASVFEQNEELKKYATTLDKCLAYFAKKAEDNSENFSTSLKLKKNPKLEETEKVIEKELKPKIYDPLQHSLSTRSCPDHPGVGIIRVGDHKYKCSLDSKVYDFYEGFTDIYGNKIPGTSIENQKDYDVDHKGEMIFDSRQSRMTI